MFLDKYLLGKTYIASQVSLNILLIVVFAILKPKLKLCPDIPVVKNRIVNTILVPNFVFF